MGKPLWKKSIIMAKTSGLMTFHSTESSSILVIVIKSEPKKTPLTPSTRNKSLAKGLQYADETVGKSNVVPGSKT